MRGGFPAALALGALLGAGCSGGETAPEPTATATSVFSSSVTLNPSTSSPVPPAPTPTATATATRSPKPLPTPRPATYRWSSHTVTAASLGSSWRPGCPVPPSSLRLLKLPYWDWSGTSRTGELVVHRSLVTSFARVFADLYEARFPIRSMRTVDEFGASDDRSMAADNTSAFNCRDAVGGSGWSQHAYGRAVDVNPRENPYVYDGSVLPPEGAPYVDRTPRRKGMAYPGGVLNRAFARQGFSWGGTWRNPDYQHFSRSGT